MALTHNATEGLYTTDFVSAMELNYRELNETLYKPYGDEGVSYRKLRDMGYESSVSSPTWEAFEKDWAHSNFKVTGNTSEGSAGAAVNLQIHADYIDADGKFYPRVGDIITFKGKTAKQGIVTVINVGSTSGLIAVKPTNTGLKIPAVATGETLIITSGAQGDGSGLPKPAITRYTGYEYQAQIIKEAVMSTGQALTTKTVFPLLNRAGEAQGLYSESFADGEVRLMKKIDGMLLVGRKNTAATAQLDALADSGDYQGKVLTSTSLLEASQDRGFATTAWGSWSNPVTDFDDVTNNLLAQRVSRDTVVWASLGAETNNFFTNGFQTFFNQNNDQFITMARNAFGISQEAGMDMKVFNKGGFTFSFDVNYTLSDPQTFNSEGYGYNEYGFLIPLRKMASTTDDNRKIPNFGVRYMKMGGYDRRFLVDTLAGFGATYGGKQPINGYDLTKHVWMTQQGAEFMEANALSFLSKA